MIFLEKIVNSIQPYDSEYALLDENRNIMANAVVFIDIAKQNTLDIGEIDPIAPIPRIVESLIEFAKLHDYKFITFPRLSKKNNKFIGDADLNYIYDNHGGEGNISYGMNYTLYEYINKHFHIHELTVTSITIDEIHDKNGKYIDPGPYEQSIYETIAPCMIISKTFKLHTPLSIHIDVMDGENKITSNILSSCKTTASIYSYTRRLTKSLKRVHPYEFSIDGKTRTSVHGQERVNESILNNPIMCCCLVFEKTILLNMGNIRGDDIYLNIYINGKNVSENDVRAFRLNKWRNHTINDIEFIDPSYGYEYANRNEYASLTSIEFHMGFEYNQAYNCLIRYAHDSKTPKMLSNIYVERKILETKSISHSDESSDDIETSDDNKISYIYLIREREFINSNQDVYKIGRTTQERSLRIERFSAYKKGSEIILLKRVSTPKVVTCEKQLIDIFMKHYEKHPDGKEYFIGNPNDMCSIIEQECANFQDE